MKAQEIRFSDEDNSFDGCLCNEMMVPESLNNTPTSDTPGKDILPRAVSPVEYSIIHTGSYMSLFKKDNNQYYFYNPTNNTYSNYYEDARVSNDDGYACVKINGYWGAIDKNFTMIVPAIYEYVWTFFEGHAVVKKSGKYGVVNTNGEEIIPIEYDNIHLKSNGLMSVEIDGLFGFINIKGETVIPLRKYEQRWACYEGLSCVQYNGKYGFIAEKGYEIPCIYDEIHYGYGFTNGYAEVVVDGKKKRIDKFGNYVDVEVVEKPNLINNNNYDEIGDFHEGLATAYRNGKYGYINVRGQLAIDLKYNFAHDFHNSAAPVIESKLFSVQMGFIDYQGDYILSWNRKKGFAPVQWLGTSGIVMSLTTDKFGCINKRGEIIVPIIYDDINSFEEVLIVKYQDKYGCIDRRGEIIVPIIYDDINNFEEVLIVKYQDKYGLLNKYGKEIIPISFGYEGIIKSEEIWSFRKDGKWGFYSPNFNIIIPHRYEDGAYTNRFKRGYSDVLLNGRYILIDRNGVEYEYVEGYDASVFTRK